MNFDKFDKFVEGEDLTDAEKNSAKFSMMETAKFGQEYKESSYMIPFAFINFSMLAESFMLFQHPAFADRDDKFKEEDFPELNYGEDETQPALSKVFAEYLNVMYATLIHEQIEKLQHQEAVDVLFENDKFKYVLKDKSMEEQYGTVVQYANVFL